MWFGLWSNQFFRRRRQSQCGEHEVARFSPASRVPSNWVSLPSAAAEPHLTPQGLQLTLWEVDQPQKPLQGSRNFL